MSNLKFCQGPDCHTYFTQDRLKGPKGNKTNDRKRKTTNRKFRRTNKYSI